MCSPTYCLLEDLVPAIIIDDGTDLLRGRVGLDNSELTLHALLVLLTVLPLYFLVVLNCLDEFGLDETGLTRAKL